MSKGLRINNNKTEYIEYDFRDMEHIENKKRQVMKSGDKVGEAERFMYLLLVLQKNVGFKVDINQMDEVKTSIRCFA